MIAFVFSKSWFEPTDAMRKKAIEVGSKLLQEVLLMANQTKTKKMTTETVWEIFFFKKKDTNDKKSKVEIVFVDNDSIGTRLCRRSSN